MGRGDTIAGQAGFAMDSNLTTSFYNELAAVPSLHVGFAVAVGIALAAALRHPLARSLALLWRPATGLAAVVNGKHTALAAAPRSRPAPPSPPRCATRWRARWRSSGARRSGWPSWSPATTTSST